MTETNDYEKAKQECFEKLPLIISPNNAFEFGFHSAWHIQEENYTGTKRLYEHHSDERTMRAAMAMQGLLSSGDYTTAKIDRVMKLAVEYADALLTELNKPKNETDKED